MSKEKFATRIQSVIGKDIPAWIPRGTYKGRTYDHILADVKMNFIDGRYPDKCWIKGQSDKNGDLPLHKYASHLNSSQVMCISFFKKFFEKEAYEKILLDILIKSGIKIGETDQIAEAIFEYEPDAEERTNFDFYLIFESEMHISFEIKYTEPEFGGISPDPEKYARKWTTIYEGMVDRSPYLNIGKDEYYENYQINRNISYAREKDKKRGADYVLFLTPRANDDDGLSAGRDYIDSFHSDHILNLYWEDVIAITQSAVKDIPELEDYYGKFFEKYIKIFGEI
jgi:hypothetical protein